MTDDILSRLDRWIAYFGESVGPGRANPDNDIPYLLRDAKAEIERLRSLADGWHDISTAPTDDTLILAYCPPDEVFPNGRMMIWRADILAKMDARTSAHLQFPATHWMPLPEPPAIRARHHGQEGG